jgi:hypothetical protein
MLPIQMAMANGHSKDIVYDLLRHDMPIDMKEKAVAKLVPHQYSWNYIVSQANDMYHDVVSKVLQQCTQPQILALSQVPNKSGEIALATATPLCKHEVRVMFRLFHTLEVADTTVRLGSSNFVIIFDYPVRPPSSSPFMASFLCHGF